jgi:methylmalonyl-CoA/ethylmalonyl-CoA epimerase
VHHLCFEVDDIEATLARLRAEGVTLVGQAPRPGAGGCKVAFLHPKSAGGVLIEISEKPRK